MKLNELIRLYTLKSNANLTQTNTEKKSTYIYIVKIIFPSKSFNKIYVKCKKIKKCYKHYEWLQTI